MGAWSHLGVRLLPFFNLKLIWCWNFSRRWEYRPLVRSGGLDNLQAASWRSDDGSLRIEPLRGDDIIFHVLFYDLCSRCWESERVDPRHQELSRGRLKVWCWEAKTATWIQFCVKKSFLVTWNWIHDALWSGFEYKGWPVQYPPPVSLTTCFVQINK